MLGMHRILILPYIRTAGYLAILKAGIGYPVKAGYWIPVSSRIFHSPYKYLVKSEINKSISRF
jgi:hypothetical protein